MCKNDFIDEDEWWQTPAAYAAYRAAAQKKIDDAAAAAKAAEDADTDATVEEAPVTDTTAPVEETPATSTFDPTPYRTLIDTEFAPFTPDWYTSEYASAYDPQKTDIETQYGTAKDLLSAGLAKKGLGASTQAKSVFGQLDTLKGTKLSDAEKAAQDYRSKLETDIGASKTSLYGDVVEGADKAATTASAKKAAEGFLATDPKLATLSDVFSSITAPYTSANISSPGAPVNPAEQAYATGGALNLAGGAGGAGSTKVVGSKKKKYA